MEDRDLKHVSVALYQYMCQHIVGSEEAVKTKRLLMTIRDNLSFGKNGTLITSGSFGEGLEMKGSDFDFMHVMTNLQVHENIPEIQMNSPGTYFTVKTEDTKPGFVKLLLVYSQVCCVINLCVEVEGCLYLSNHLIKRFIKSLLSTCHYAALGTEVDHGPCLSDKEGLFDFAASVHSKSWISQAEFWVTRPNQSWPTDEVKSKIIEHGVLFVPVGVKGSRNEEIEWRISFSVGEKLLIYTFTHTQLVCYALMKIVLKDIINSDENCKDLLCSYYIKNIIFWVSEELPISFWKPQNLISCLMRCFRRLIYFVEYSICPHYFIPINNMFENKIEGHNRGILLTTLNALYDLDWQLILFSSQLHDFLRTHNIRYSDSQLFISYIEHMNLSSVILDLGALPDNYHRCINMLSSYRSPTIKFYHQFYLTTLCQQKAEKIQLLDINKNRDTYTKYKVCQSYLLQNLHRDAVSGWLELASLFYKIKLYRRALVIVSYALSKCTQEMFLRGSKLSSVQREILKAETFQRIGLIRIFKLLCLDDLDFARNSTLIPKELELEVFHSGYTIPPVVYAHFLSCLCNFHLGDARQFRNSLEDLQLTISEEYFILLHDGYKSVSYNCLGIALQLMGDKDLARNAFLNAIQLEPDGLSKWSARIRLSMMNAE